MFENDIFTVYNLDTESPDRSGFLVDACYMEYFETSELEFDVTNVEPDKFPSAGYLYVESIPNQHEEVIKFKWTPLYFNRNHSISISIPKNKILACVDCWQHDEKPHYFVDSDYLRSLGSRYYSVFCLIDAVDVTKFIQKNKINRDVVVEVRNAIDDIAKEHPDITFISFADSVILKSNWRLIDGHGTFEYAYRPEEFFEIIEKIQSVYLKKMNTTVYAVLSQGDNWFYADNPVHISPMGNHLSLNSLGAPFAQLWDIETAVKIANEDKLHSLYDLYMDEDFFLSLRLESDDRSKKSTYCSRVQGLNRSYYYENIDVILRSIN